MSIVAVAIARVFMYNGRTLQDPDPEMTPDEARQFYSAIHPELLNASVEDQGFVGDAHSYEFKRSVGSKG